MCPESLYHHPSKMNLAFSVPQHHRPPETTAATPPPATNLSAALDLATQSAKILSCASPDPSQALAAISSLRTAHEMIGSLIAQLDPPPPVDESMSCGDEEMDGGAAEASRIVEDMEEGMRDCNIGSKRRKRRVSPSWSGGRPADRLEESSSVDPMERRRSALDLVFQFHA